MDKEVILVLEDGSIYSGRCLGAEVDACGEVVFCTSMVGYQEMLTDPSYAGQILVPTYPLIGNYGINDMAAESAKVQVQGFVVKEQCLKPSHYTSRETLGEYLARNGIPGIYGVDTRAITRRLRSSGTMMGMITTNKSAQQAMDDLYNLPGYGSTDFVRQVTTDKTYTWHAIGDIAMHRIVVLDCGLKYNILRILNHLGCETTVVPCTASAADILALRPDGILLSPGPGNPELLDYVVTTIKGLTGQCPIMGICLGNQLIARSFGAKTFKLKFGHRGGNHPVRDLATGKVYITAQNHGYAVDPDTLGDDLEVTHINLNDGTVEGLKHKKLPIFAIQYHSEASPGPCENAYLFTQFLDMIDAEKKT